MLRILAILGGAAIVGCGPATLPEAPQAAAIAEGTRATPEKLEEVWCSAGEDRPAAQLAAEVALRNGKRVWSVAVPMVLCSADKVLSAPNVCCDGDDPLKGIGAGGCAELHESRLNHAMVNLDLNWDLGAGVGGGCEATFLALLDHDQHEEQLSCGLSVLTRFDILVGRPSKRRARLYRASRETLGR